MDDLFRVIAFIRRGRVLILLLLLFLIFHAVLLFVVFALLGRQK
jgi:hypothetical protein